MARISGLNSATPRAVPLGCVVFRLDGVRNLIRTICVGSRADLPRLYATPRENAGHAFPAPGLSRGNSSDCSPLVRRFPLGWRQKSNKNNACRFSSGSTKTVCDTERERVARVSGLRPQPWLLLGLFHLDGASFSAWTASEIQ